MNPGLAPWDSLPRPSPDGDWGVEILLHRESGEWLWAETFRYPAKMIALGAEYAWRRQRWGTRLTYRGTPLEEYDPDADEPSATRTATKWRKSPTKKPTKKKSRRKPKKKKRT